MAPPPALPLDWLRPTLERCRALLAPNERPVQPRVVAEYDGHVVTDLDLEVERILTNAIRERFPVPPILSEETQPTTSVPDDVEVGFVIDPIDGTDELLAGRSGFTISVAQYRVGRPVAGVLDFPRSGTRFEGGEGLGVWRDHQPVELARPPSLAEARVAVSVTQHQRPALRSVWDRLHKTELVPTPAFTPKFATILRGDCAAAVHLPVDDRRTYLWDYAAANVPACRGRRRLHRLDRRRTHTDEPARTRRRLDRRRQPRTGHRPGSGAWVRTGIAARRRGHPIELMNAPGRGHGAGRRRGPRRSGCRTCAGSWPGSCGRGCGST